MTSDVPDFARLRCPLCGNTRRFRVRSVIEEETNIMVETDAGEPMVVRLASQVLPHEPTSKPFVVYCRSLVLGTNDECGTIVWSKEVPG